MLVRTAGEDEAAVERGRRRGRPWLAVLGLALLLLVGGLAGFVGYVWQAGEPVRLGRYTVAGPRCQNVLAWSQGPTPGRMLLYIVYSPGPPVKASFSMSDAQAGYLFARAKGGGLRVVCGRVVWQWGGFKLLGP